MIPKTLRNFNAFIDGIGWAGLVEEGTPPKIAIAVLEHKAGGMAAPIDLDSGMVEKMECEMSFAEFNPALFTQLGNSDATFTLRGAQSDGTVTQGVVYQMRGLVKTNEPSSWKPGEKGTLKVMMTCSFLRLTIDGSDVVEIDAINMRRVIGGVDQLAEQRSALGF